MPPKSVTCSICSASVLKAQTFARADGTRACRSHEGVADEAEKRAAAERARLDAAVSKGTCVDQWARDRTAEREKHGLMFEKEAAAWREHLYSHCWTCEAEGLEGHEFFAQAMVATKRLELRGEFNFLSVGSDVQKLMGGVRLLVPFQSKDEAIDKAVVKHVKDKRVRDILHFVRFVLICPPCANKHGFGKRLDDMMPKPTWEQLENMLPVVAGMEPLLRVMAEKKEGQA